MLGIRKINGVQFDLYSGNFEGFFCDAWVFLSDKKNPPYPGSFTSARELKALESHGLMENLRLFEVNKENLQNFRLLLVHYSSLAEGVRSFLGGSNQLKLNHIALVFNEHTNKDLGFKTELLMSLNQMEKPPQLRRITLIVENVDEYRIWQEIFWKILPDSPEL